MNISFSKIIFSLYLIFLTSYSLDSQTNSKKNYQKFKAELKKAKIKLYDYRTDKSAIQLSKKKHSYKSVEGQIWSEGRLIVYNKVDGFGYIDKFGCIDDNNKLVIDFIYDGMSNFLNGYSIVTKDKKSGVINKNGKVIVPLVYQTIEFCCNNIYRDKSNEYFLTKLNDLYGLVNNKGETIFQHKYDYIFRENGKFYQRIDGKDGVVNIGDSIIVPFIFDQISTTPINNLIEVKYNNKWGAKDTFFKDVIPYEFYFLQLGENGIHKIGTKGDKFGFINSKGQIIVDTIYDGARLFSENLAKVVLNNKVGYVDTTGKIIVPIKYDEGYEFRQGLAPVQLNNKWGFCNTKGELVIDLIYDDTRGFNEENKAYVELNGKSFYIDKQGNRM